MAVNLSPVGGVAAQFFDNAGNVLTGGKLYTYSAGTTTPQTAYTTSAGNVAWSNPIILDAAGRVSGSGEIWLSDGIQYKFILRDSNDVLIATYDNVNGINSNFVNFTNEQEIQTATAGQTIFNLTTTTYSPGTNSLSVFVDGVNQYGPGAQYAYLETDADTVTFVNGLHVGALVKFTTSQLNSSGAVDASQVSYDPPFINSVPTNVEARLAQYVSVKDFGAVGDGVTNDTTAFQNAVDFSNQNNIGIYVPAGTYTVDQITILDNVTVIGENVNNCTIFLRNGNNGAIFNAADKDNITVENLTFDYNPVNNPGPPPSGDALSAIVVGSYADIKNCKFVGCLSYAVIGYGSYNKVYYCEFTKGAYTERGACTWFIKTTGANYNEMCFNTASGVKFGFLVEQTSGGSVCTGNVFSNNHVTDLVLDANTEAFAPAAAYNAWGCNRTTITNNTATNCVGPGIRLIASAFGSIVTGNNCLNVGLGSLITGATAGIDIGDSAAYADNNLVIANNVVAGTGGPGFWLTSVYNSVIDGNVSNNNGISLNPPPAWTTDFWKSGFVIASETDSPSTPVANNTFSNNVCTGNVYAVSRIGNTAGVIVENIYVGNMFDGNFTTSLQTSPNTDIYVGNTGQGQASKVYSYQINYGFNGAEAATLTNLYNNAKLMTGFTDAFTTNPGLTIQSTGSLGFGIGATFADANRKVILRDTGAFNFVPQAQPATAQAGDVYYSSSTNKLRCYDGTIWNDLF
jgi:parallel beta-helix repeat protein